MIYVWDNGEPFSAHEIDFVESDLPEQDVLVILRAAKYTDSESMFVLGVLPNSGWRSPKSTTSLSAWCEQHLAHYNHNPPCSSDSWGKKQACDCDAALAMTLVAAHKLL